MDLYQPSTQKNMVFTKCQRLLVFVLVSCIGYILTGCSDHSLLSQIPEIPDEEDWISGRFDIHGYQVNLTLCYISQFCEPRQVLSRDTVETSFTIRIEIHKNRKDTLRFFGLEEAPNDPSCSFLRKNPRDCGFALLTGNRLTFDLLSPGGEYVGEGTLEKGRISLETRYRYRGRGTDYFLEGTKIFD